MTAKINETNLDAIHSIVQRKLMAVEGSVAPTAGVKAEPLSGSHPDADHTVLIDVRSDEEWRAGIIPTAVHIPMHKLQDALTLMTSDEGARTYGLTKPVRKDEHHLLFYCGAGVRSLAALHMAEGAGFRFVSHYLGGWDEYCQRPVILPS